MAKSRSTARHSAAPRLDQQPAARAAFAGIRAAIVRHRKRLLALPNVLEVRPGFKFKDGWITDHSAIVVVVARKVPEDQLKTKERIPAELDGIPIDVAPASPLEQLRYSTSRLTRAAAAALPEPDLWLPGREVVKAQTATGTRSTVRGAGASGRGYRKPPKLKLKAASGPLNLICHASPDAGWPTLKAFFAGIQRRCTVAMYDFTAPHVFAGLKQAMEHAEGTLQLCYDGKASTDRDGEMKEAEIVGGLQQDLKDRLDEAKAAVGNLYPNAYHIKVAVRDGKAFWLSSGNWQNSNQPPDDASKLDVAAQRKLLAEHNREWHVVVEHAGLAQTFEKYIQWDMSEARRVQERALPGLAPAPLPDLFLPPEAEEPLVTRAAPIPVTIFPPLVLSSIKLKIQPLLTPDNYGEFILPLLKSAKKSLYLQNQYIHYGPNNTGVLKDLVAVLVSKVREGLDVRIVLRDGDSREMLEALQNTGFNMQQVKLLRGCHNKGIVVDSKVAVVSSQNWSGDGVQYNRDAGLILHHPQVAKYFEQIFLYDWDHRAHQKALAERAMPLLAPPAAAPRAKRTRGPAPTSWKKIAWSDFYGD